MFRNLALVYARNHPTMRTGSNCDEHFQDGITNGAHWYELNGMLLVFIVLIKDVSVLIH